MEVADDRYRIGAQVRIIDDLEYKNNRNTKGHNGTAAGCKQERNENSHLVAFNVLLDEYKAYGLLVVVKGTPWNVCHC